MVDILAASTQKIADASVLTGATATGEELPAGITVSGDAGVEPTLAIDESQSVPTERKIYTVYKGSGEELANGARRSCTRRSLVDSERRDRLSRPGRRRLKKLP